jgi:protein O-mannosyl-transferase
MIRRPQTGEGHHRGGPQAREPQRAASWRNEPTPTAPSGSGYLKAGVCCVLAAACLVIYAQTLRFDFTNYDDDKYSTDNSMVKAGLTGQGVVWALTTTHTGYWHALTWLSLMLDVTVFGPGPAGHHLVNVLIHVASSMLLFLTLARLTGSVWRSACVAILFAVHPLNVESVAWISERKNVLSTFFWMLTLLAYASYAARPGVLRYSLVLVPFALGLMAKPMGVTLPCVLLLLDVWPLNRLQQAGTGSRGKAARLLQLVVEKLPFVPFIVACSIMTYVAQHSGGITVSLEAIPFGARIASALVGYLQYMRMMVWPAGLAVFYPHPGTTLPLWQPVLATVALAAITALVSRWGRLPPYAAVGWLWYLGTLVPVIGIVQVGSQAYADRYAYVPLIGLFIAITWTAADLAPRLRLPNALLPSIAGGLFFSLTLCARHQVGYWRDSGTLFTHALDVTRNNGLAHNNLGAYLASTSRRSEAIAEYEAALRINGRAKESLCNLAKTLSELGRTDEAILYAQRAVEAGPTYSTAHTTLGNLMSRAGKTDQAITHYRRAQSLNPNSVEAHYNLGLLLESKGLHDQAISEYEATLRLDPMHTSAHNNLAIALAAQGRIDQAVAHYRHAIRLSPVHVGARYNLAATLAMQGKLDDAITEYREVLRVAPRDAMAHKNLGVALHRRGRTADALDHFREAAAIRPDWPEPMNDIAWILATDRNPVGRNGGEALRLAQRVCELTHGAHPAALDTLAAAYAELGRFDQAAGIAQKGIDLATLSGNLELVRQMKDRLRRYQSSQPYRESGP